MEKKVGSKSYFFEEGDLFFKGYDHDVYICKDKKGKPYFLAIPQEGRYEEVLKAKKFLKKIGVDGPKIKKADGDNGVILMKYVEVAPVTGLLLKEEIEEGIYEEIFRLAKFARLSKYTIDFRPENYFYGRKGMFYFGTSFKPLKEEERFERGDIALWMRTKEGIKHLKDLGYDVSHLVPYTELEAKKAIVLRVVKDYQ